eukprot:CAMPEP_0113482118 /NCGR_PEP_ID=MMETSP0014_2-20120614/22755_1 /TAXON_ID=2857 /ORGANISM="Nitzschia sp." /LENGTH=889 /DNA_ID=CAMNT_0000375627 /DNA_START=65 /DNA_END=2734 /DNA_ORIENTATION=+ /assembly_acc=CAM_ASM_000159
MAGVVVVIIIILDSILLSGGFHLQIATTTATTTLADDGHGRRRRRHHYHHHTRLQLHSTPPPPSTTATTTSFEQRRSGRRDGPNVVGRKWKCQWDNNLSSSNVFFSPMSRRWSTPQKSTTLSSSASSSSTDESLSPTNSKRKQMMITFSRCLLLVGLFATGFWAGGSYHRLAVATAKTGVKTATATSTATAASTSTGVSSMFFRRFPIFSILVVAVLARDVWRNVIPAWAKPRLVDRAIRDTKLLLGIKSKTEPRLENDDERRKDDASSGNSNDIGDIDTLIGKINAVKTIMTKTIDAKIIIDHDGDDNDDDDDKYDADSSSTTTTTTTATKKRAKKKTKKKKPKFNLSTAFFTYQILIRQFKDVQHSPVRDMWYQQQQHKQQYGNKTNSDESKSSSSHRPSSVLSQSKDDDGEKVLLLKRLPLLLDMADWAYDEDPSGLSLKDLLNEQNYTLVKHDKTPLPGYLGHYVAIPTQQKPNKNDEQQRKEERRAVIGLKGTSGLEDFMTDLCGASVELDVDVDAKEWRRKMKIQQQPPSSSFPSASASTDGGDDDSNNSTVTIRAHEGVAIASRRLADDLKPIVENLLLPQGYRLTIVGHSLGAAGASLLSIILCAEIPSLHPSQLEVFAFASPPALDLQTAKAVESFTTTIVNNNDVIPRMNVASVGSTVDMLKILDDRRCLRDEELERIRQTYRQQHRWWYQRWKNRSQFIDQKNSLMDDKPLLTDVEYLDAMYNSTSRSNDANVAEGDNPDHLYVPGKVVLLYKSWSNETSTITTSSSSGSGSGSADYDSHISAPNIVMSNIDGTDDTQTTTTLAEVTSMTAKDDDDDDDDDGDGMLSTSSSIVRPDRVVFCETTSSPIRILELDPTLIDDHMPDGYRRSLQSVVSLVL